MHPKHLEATVFCFRQSAKSIVQWGSSHLISVVPKHGSKFVAIPSGQRHVPLQPREPSSL